MKFEFTTTPNSFDINFLSQKIDAENIEYEPISSFGFFIKNEENEIIGGCNGYIICGCIYTDQLWVSKEYRKTGLGKELMKRVEEFGMKMGCKLASVNTMSFQGAKGFYERLGYRVDFERKGYINDVSMIFLSKKI